MWTVGPDDVAEGDRTFESRVEWMPCHRGTGGDPLVLVDVGAPRAGGRTTHYLSAQWPARELITDTSRSGAFAA